MDAPTFTIEPEPPGLDDAIDALLDQAFGLARRTKTSYRLREGEEPVAGLSFIARRDGVLAGTVRFWPLKIGRAGTDALLLGPLAVDRLHRGRGIGLRLMARGLAEAAQQGHRLVILVGDEPYYGKIGFHRIPEHRLLFPGPVEPDRLLWRELAAVAAAAAGGLVLPPHRWRGLNGVSAALAAPEQAVGPTPA